MIEIVEIELKEIKKIPESVRQTHYPNLGIIQYHPLGWYAEPLDPTILDRVVRCPYCHETQLTSKPKFKCKNKGGTYLTSEHLIETVNAPILEKLKRAQFFKRTKPGLYRVWYNGRYHVDHITGKDLHKLRINGHYEWHVPKIISNAEK